MLRLALALALFTVLVRAPVGTAVSLHGRRHGPHTEPPARRQLQQAAAAPDLRADPGLDQYIVTFVAGAGPAAEAADRLVAEVAAAGAPDVTAAAAAAGDDAELSIVSQLGAGGQDEADGTAAAAASSSGQGSGVQGIVVRASPTTLQHIRRSKLVAHVVRDRPIAAQAAVACVRSASSLQQGVSVRPSSSFQWAGCLTSRSKLVWRAQLCGADKTKLAYSEIRAVSKTTGAVIKVAGQPCILTPSPRKDANSRAKNQQRFGSCGVAPSLATSLPSSLCSADEKQQPPRSPSPSPSPAASPSPPPPSPSPEVPSPSPDVPSPEPEPSPSPAVPSPSPDASGNQSLPINPEVLSPSPSPSPSPAPNTLPRVPLAAGETVPTGVLRVEAASATAAISTIGLPLEQQVVVGIVDGGVDGTHPDLNLVGGMTWAKPNAAVPNDDASPDVDMHGHGTHCAGTVGAKNSGAGVVGISPGVPIFSLKVLDGAGKGTLAGLLSAVKWATTEGRARGIRVLNLSLTAFVAVDDEDYLESYNLVCGVMQEASDAGIFVAVAAGNYGQSLRNYLPAACPTVAAVTAVDGPRGASFSNFLPAFDSRPAEQAHVMAAPGTSIYSTMSFAKEPSGYKILSGTSMASPHVAGIAANCLMSGACPAGSTGADSLAIMQAAAQEKYSLAPSYGFSGDAATTVGEKFYGFMAWAGKF